MPWKGRPSFLLDSGRDAVACEILCQCPERGDLHFYKRTVRKEMLELIVSMPWKRRPSFLLDNTELLNKMANCVNALKGATFISTLASGNPCKSRLCGSIFPYVFQNILKKAFLNGVFWKFTICSYLTVPFLLLVYLFFLGLRSTYSTLLIG